MDEHLLKCFKAISDFVQDLNTNFGKKYQPVALYNRLLELTTLKDDASISRHIAAFKLFFMQNPKYVTEHILSSNNCIKYSDRVYLDMGKILYKCDKPSTQTIYKHLVLIYSLVNIGTDNDATKDALNILKNMNDGPAKGVDRIAADLNLPDTTEGNFIKDTLSEMSMHFENMDNTAGNPMQMMNGMMQSGFFNKYMTDLQNKFTSGEMSIGSLMNTVTGLIQKTAPSGPEGDQMKNLLSSTLQTFAGGSVNPQELSSQLPEEMRQGFDQLLSSFAPVSEPAKQDDINTPD